MSALYIMSDIIPCRNISDQEGWVPFMYKLILNLEFLEQRHSIRLHLKI